MQAVLRSLGRGNTLQNKRFNWLLGEFQHSMSTKYETLDVSSPADNVVHVKMNRPEKRNAISQVLLKEFIQCFKDIGENKDVRAVVLSGAGKMFSAGLDLMDFMPVFVNQESSDVARKGLHFRSFIKNFQEIGNILEKINQPVIAAVHGGCVGGGVDIITACDMRVCSLDAWFQVKEVIVGMVADVGTLQRISHTIGNQSLVRELCYTGRKLTAEEAVTCGFVSQCHKDYDTLIEEAVKLASNIAEKSPVVTSGIKYQLNYARDHSVADGLENVATWNMSALQSEDVVKAVQAMMSGSKAVYSKL